MTCLTSLGLNCDTCKVEICFPHGAVGKAVSGHHATVCKVNRILGCSPTPTTSPLTWGHGIGLRMLLQVPSPTDRLGTDSGLLPWLGQTRQVALPDKVENAQVNGNFRQRVIFFFKFLVQHWEWITSLQYLGHTYTNNYLPFISLDILSFHLLHLATLSRPLFPEDPEPGPRHRQ